VSCRVTQAIAGLVEGRVGVAVTDPRDPQPDLMPREAALVARAIVKRQREFAAGRAVARAAMAQLGGEAQEILASEDRAPVWPAGWRGSITHKDRLCAAMVTQDAVSLGLDIEEATPLGEDLIPRICDADESAAIDGPEKGLHAKLIFSAKEAAYKAQYPLSGLLFGFHHLHLSLDTQAQRFTATFRAPATPFQIGDRLLGRYTQVAGHFVTAVSVPLDAKGTV